MKNHRGRRWWYRVDERHPRLTCAAAVVGVLLAIIACNKLDKRVLREEQEYFKGTRLEEVYTNHH